MKDIHDVSCRINSQKNCDEEEFEEEAENKSTAPELTVQSHSRMTRKKGTVLPWTSAEKQIIFSVYSNEIRNQRVPDKAKCIICLRKNKFQNDRTWQHLKWKKLHNYIIQTAKRVQCGT